MPQRMAGAPGWTRTSTRGLDLAAVPQAESEHGHIICQFAAGERKHLFEEGLRKKFQGRVGPVSKGLDQSFLPEEVAIAAGFYGSVGIEKKDVILVQLGLVLFPRPIGEDPDRSRSRFQKFHLPAR